MMTEKELESLQAKAEKARSKLLTIGPMRPGNLNQQFKNPQEKTGGYWQLSYTYKMRSKTEYVKPESIGRIKKEILNFKKFKEQIEIIIDLDLQISKLKSKNGIE